MEVVEKPSLAKEDPVIKLAEVTEFVKQRFKQFLCD